MRFEDEQYVRLYKRDTTTWLMLNWQGRCILPLIFRKLDRAGILDLNEDGYEALAAHIQVPLEVVEEGMASILKRKALDLRPDGLLLSPRFIEAQEAKQSDKARQKSARDRARDLAAARVRGLLRPADAVTESDDTVTDGDAAVTPRDETVTRSHTTSQGVTLSCAQQSPAKQSRAEGVRGAAPSAEGSALLPIVDSEPEAEGSASKSRKRGRLPQTFMREDWQPKTEHAEYVRSKGLEVAAVVEDFRNHWMAEGKLGANWDARFKQNVDRILRTAWLVQKFAAPEEAEPLVPAPSYGPPVPPPPEALAVLARMGLPMKPRPDDALGQSIAAVSEAPGAPVFWTPKTSGGRP